MHTNKEFDLITGISDNYELYQAYSYWLQEEYCVAQRKKEQIQEAVEKRQATRDKYTQQRVLLDNSAYKTSKAWYNEDHSVKCIPTKA